MEPSKHIVSNGLHSLKHQLILKARSEEKAKILFNKYKRSELETISSGTSSIRLTPHLQAFKSRIGMNAVPDLIFLRAFGWNAAKDKGLPDQNSLIETGLKTIREVLFDRFSKDYPRLPHKNINAFIDEETKYVKLAEIGRFYGLDSACFKYLKSNEVTTSQFESINLFSCQYIM